MVKTKCFMITVHAAQLQLLQDCSLSMAAIMSNTFIIDFWIFQLIQDAKGTRWKVRLTGNVGSCGSGVTAGFPLTTRSTPSSLVKTLNSQINPYNCSVSGLHKSKSCIKKCVWISECDLLGKVLSVVDTSKKHLTNAVHLTPKLFLNLLKDMNGSNFRWSPNSFVFIFWAPSVSEQTVVLSKVKIKI